MASKSKPCFSLPPFFPSFLFFFFFFFFSLRTHLSLPTDSLSFGQSLSGKQTLISKEGNFELGFFSPSTSNNNFYIGIWYKKLPTQTIIWVANRDAPIFKTSSAELKVSDQGNLVLLNGSKSPIWLSSSTPSYSNATSAVLLDSGNFVLTNSVNSSIIWQSFDHPGDTWMPGGWLGFNKITGEYLSITCWENPENPARGPFSESLDPDGSNQYVLLYNGSQVYWSSGLWNGQYFSSVPGTAQQTVFNFTFVDNRERKYAMYTITDSSVITRFVVGSSGLGQQFLWLSNRQEWQPVFTQPLSHCDVPSLCGPFGLCDLESPSLCRCPQGFEPVLNEEWELNDWNLGCKRKTQLKCGTKSNLNREGEERDGFFMMINMRLPSNGEKLMVISAEECEMACLNNCSCSAYSFDTSCLIWTANLQNLQQLYSGDHGGGTVYLRLAAADLPSTNNSHKVKTVVIVSLVGGLLGMVIVLFGLIWLCRRWRKSQILSKVEGSLIRFSYGDLRHATKNFSEKLGGGGFGSVFKGALPDSTQVAVKKLEGSRQGEKQFQAEVLTLGAIQHINLLRLCGFCCESSQRLLVYEFMPNGSLDSVLFKKDSDIMLSWNMRYRISLGIARGLAYLHEECRECIIHCDIKPGNILLDADFKAKVADFGMAKLIGRDFSRVLTTMRGTIGYLAPEWISGLPISPKVDVYSFGMMLFEIISGQRNSMHFEEGSKYYYPSWAAQKVIEGDEKCLLDSRLGGEADLEEVRRASRVACWCIQDAEMDRPIMGQVVQSLEGVLEVDVPRIPRSLQHLMEDQISHMYDDVSSVAEQGASESSQGGYK
ncbi:G-type lectin S-receptor-like serine/threonine-protein kinase At2g19130 isoform X1 [Ananas comosus]|uniref:Receptor-like serine/threonine-protein kinase n=1 Tax=Ananas comosus TaxID=4615 RepID=A0A6P5EII2_ANACO|nr:G-type lectin S-receptor-like serine/threonine-protein kinase At2g19130 isoform X1 [Ananas comosus]